MTIQKKQKKVDTTMGKAMDKTAGKGKVAKGKGGKVMDKTAGKGMAAKGEGGKKKSGYKPRLTEPPSPTKKRGKRKK
jgi:hypothetical protein